MRRSTTIQLVLILAALLLGHIAWSAAQDFNPFEVRVSPEQLRRNTIRFNAEKMGRDLFGTNPTWTKSGPLSRKKADEIQVGDWGFYREPFTVIQRLDNETVLTSLDWSNRTAVLHGLDFSKTTDGMKFVLLHPIGVAGTRTFQNVSGVTTTALVIECKLDEVRKLMPPDTREFRKWTRRNGTTFEGTLVESKLSKVKIESRIGGMYVMPLGSLSSADRKFIYQQLHPQRKTAKAKPAKSNAAAVVTDRESPPAPQPTTTIAVMKPARQETTQPTDKRTRYINATYHGVIRVHNGQWEALDQTGKHYSNYEYVGRTNDYVELIDRGMPTRLYADHIEQQLNGKWSRVADGHWEE